MISASPPNSVGVVTASAGTGKTYDLTSRIEAEIQGGGAPERILASTFTVKAAGELRERTRERLIAKGEAESAIRLLGARIGTVNSVCGGLVGEFAFGQGLSPVVDVISEGSAKRILLQSADVAIGEHASELESLARAFGYDEAYRDKDWRDDVSKVVELARANNIGPEALQASKRRSIDSFAKLLSTPLPGETEASLDGDLRAAIDESAVSLSIERRADQGNRQVSRRRPRTVSKGSD